MGPPVSHIAIVRNAHWKNEKTRTLAHLFSHCYESTNAKLRMNTLNYCHLPTFMPALSDRGLHFHVHIMLYATNMHFSVLIPFYFRILRHWRAEKCGKNTEKSKHYLHAVKNWAHRHFEANQVCFEGI